MLSIQRQRGLAGLRGVQCLWWVGGLAVALALGGCGGVSLLNPAFTNTISGGVFPVTPGPSAGFILVRVANETTDTMEFVVTVEKQVPRRNNDGTFVIDANGNVLTETERRTVRLVTAPNGRANDAGVLFDCKRELVTLVGLGENLLPTDAAAFVGGAGAGGVVGFGIPVGNLNPLSYFDNNFDCGDTIIFRALRNTSVAGGVSLQSYLLPGSEQPSSVTGPNTFVNYEQFLESQIREDEP